MKKRKINIGVIPAAGTGLRMGYLSKILPKCLFPLYDKPIIYHIIQNMKILGVRDIYVIVNYKRHMLFDYLREMAPKLKVKINFIFQNKLGGIADAIMLTRKYIDQPFITILGDDVTLTDSLENLSDTLFDKDALVVEGIVREGEIAILRRTCCVELNVDNKIIKIQEKPKKPFSQLRGVGVYIFQPFIFKYIEETPVSNIRNEREITDTIKLIANKGYAYAEFIKGININVNNYNDLLGAWLSFKEYRLKYAQS